MNSPRKGKGQYLILVMLGTTILSVGAFYALIDGPRSRLREKQRALAEARSKLDESRKQIGEAARSKVAVDTAARKLQTIEARMAVGDPYRWLIKAFLDFPAGTNVLIANIEPPHVSEASLLPKVPYKTANFSITGTAYYHQFGTFMAELENYFPHMRVTKVDLTPAYPGEADSGEAEKLNFQVEITMLFKPASVATPQLSLGPVKEKQN
jgi:hypothetical protein